ncbi:GGDEF domain-containing protein [Marinomonas epiphytica]
MSERFGSLLVPLLILLASIYLSLQIASLPPQWAQLLPFLPFLVSIIAIFLAWHFNKGRALLMVLALLLPVYIDRMQSYGLNQAYWLTACGIITFVGLLQERGFFNRYVINRALFLFMLLAWGYGIEHGWVELSGLKNVALTSNITLSEGLFWLLLGFFVFVMLIAWWRFPTSYQATSLSSLACLLILKVVVTSYAQAYVILSASLLTWVWFLLLESHRMAYLDDLTQLPGRRALNEAFLGLSKHYAIAMLDVDHFKKFNDTYGHDMGDKVLKAVAKQLKTSAFQGKAFRYGGEEFTLLFKGKKIRNLEEQLEDVRQNIAEQEVMVFDPKKQKDMPVKVTVSIGLAHVESNELAESVLKRADEALYQAKRKGRNKVFSA